MKSYKITLSVLICAGFLVVCLYFRGDFLGDSIRSRMLASNILKFDSSAGIFIASKDDNSKVLQADTGKLRIFGVGALIKQGSKDGYGGGFNLLIEGTDSPFLLGKANILIATLSPDNRFLATVSVEGIINIINLEDGAIKYGKNGDKKAMIGDPFKAGDSMSPFIFWTKRGLVYNEFFEESKERMITQIIIDQRFPNIQLTLTNWDNPDDVNDTTNKNKRYVIKLADPETGEDETLKFSEDDKNLFRLVGQISPNELLIKKIPRDTILDSNLVSLKLDDATLTRLTGLGTDYFGFQSYPEKPILFYINPDSLQNQKLDGSNPTKIKLPTLDKDEVRVDQIENVRMTSKGFIFFTVPSLQKSFLLDPKSEIWTEIPKDRVPY